MKKLSILFLLLCITPHKTLNAALLVFESRIYENENTDFKMQSIQHNPYYLISQNNSQNDQNAWKGSIGPAGSYPSPTPPNTIPQPINCREVSLFTSAIATLRNKGYPLDRARTLIDTDSNFSSQEKMALKEMATIVYTRSSLSPSDHALLSSLACNLNKR